MLMWLGVIVVIILFSYLKLYKPLQKWKEEGVPYIKPILFFGNTAPFVFRMKHISELLKDMYDTHDSSRYVGLYQFSSSTLMIKDLDLIKQLGIKDFDHFVDHKQYTSDDFDPLFTRNLFTLRGQHWQHMRQTLSPAFTGTKMRAMFVLMSDCAEQFTNYFKEEIKSGQSKIIEMKDISTRYTNDIIASCAFGITCDSMKDKKNEFYEMAQDASHFGGLRIIKFLLYNICPIIMRLFNIKIFTDEVAKFFCNAISTNIKFRVEEGIIRPDIINLMIESRKGKLKHEDSKVKDEDAGFAAVEESQVGKELQDARYVISDRDITAQCMAFIIAGVDTTSVAISHMAYELALNKDVQKKLIEEIDETFREGNGKISYDAVIKMKYLDMVLSETLRKWPPAAATDRICKDSYTIPAKNPGEQPIHLKTGDVIWIPCYGLQRDPKYFPDPEKFDPERFNDENKLNIKPYSYLPFGVGPRNCLGSRFALLEIKVVFCHILSKFSFEICEKSQVPLKLTRKTVNLHAERGFWLALKSRY